MGLDRYLEQKYKNGKKDWFLDEISSYLNQERIDNARTIKEYLSGQHEILARPNFNYNGQVIEPRRIVINLAKTIVNFKTQYLLKNPVNLIGNERMLKHLQRVNKLGKFDNKNEQILAQLIKYGEVYEYVFVNRKGHIDSKIINAEDGTPIYNRNNELIAFIEHYVFDGITYYTVYTDDAVEEWTNEGGKECFMVERHINLSGLPVVYKTENELHSTIGRSELNDYINILDNMEDVISKYVDSMYKFMNPIPVAIGQQLTSGIPQEIVGGGINLDDGADFKLVQGEMDSKSFEIIYNKLNQTLLDVSSTPAVSMNKTDISNLSEVSIKLLFSLADTSAGEYENYIVDGLHDRYEKVVKLLKYKGINISEEQFITLDYKFVYNTPANNKEILDNLKTQFDMGAVSTETILDNSPYIKDTGLELKRLNEQNSGTVDTVQSLYDGTDNQTGKVAIEDVEKVDDDKVENEK